MWPVNIGGHSPNPKKCKGPPFDANKLINSPIIGELNKLWPNLKAKQSNTDLWEHEGLNMAFALVGTYSSTTRNQ
ncbi:hypothetical protein GH714_030774 [Hevea brasiliensis]|uniref:Uncharacterized protein n=1 Tax=Hevea brasiliensis TaxID=3981 RepID=A0A6A6NDR6_HEVBR|nr:hypothetical protein GH714_030774 [Hevea brasiliensis]